MASTYALPVSAMPHSHGHGHVHSHSHTPSFSPSKLGPGGQKTANTSRALQQERSNGSLHSHAHSESFYSYGNNQERPQNFEQFRINTDVTQQIQNNTLTTGRAYAEQSPCDLIPRYSQSDGYEADHMTAGHPYQDNEDYDHSHHDQTHPDHAGRDHSHHGHTHHVNQSHGHSHCSVEKRSRFTRTMLLYTERWTLLHSILKEKDSRRIFYFMTCVQPFPFRGCLTNIAAA
jgi:zinc transporter 5/7